MILLYGDGAGPANTHTVAAHSRFNVDVRSEFPDVPRYFGAVVESVGDSPVPIVVESATYTGATGLDWAAGHASMATRLR